MITTARLLKLLIRLSGMVALLLGLAFWTGHLFLWLPVHILLGLVLVLAMWVTAGLAFRAGAGQGVAAFAALWGVGVVVFGRMQVGLLPGDMHWIISLAHLLAGGVAMGLGTALASAIERSVLRSAPGAAPRAEASGGSSRRPPRPEVS